MSTHRVKVKYNTAEGYRKGALRSCIAIFFENSFADRSAINEELMGKRKILVILIDVDCDLVSIEV